MKTRGFLEEKKIILVSLLGILWKIEIDNNRSIRRILKRGRLNFRSMKNAPYRMNMEKGESEKEGENFERKKTPLKNAKEEIFNGRKKIGGTRKNRMLNITVEAAKGIIIRLFIIPKG